MKSGVDKNEDFEVRYIKMFVCVNFLVSEHVYQFLFRSSLKYLLRSGVIQEVTVVCVAIHF